MVDTSEIYCKNYIIWRPSHQRLFSFTIYFKIPLLSRHKLCTQTSLVMVLYVAPYKAHLPSMFVSTVLFRETFLWKNFYSSVTFKIKYTWKRWKIISKGWNILQLFHALFASRASPFFRTCRWEPVFIVNMKVTVIFFLIIRPPNVNHLFLKIINIRTNTRLYQMFRVVHITKLPFKCNNYNYIIFFPLMFLSVICQADSQRLF